MTLHLHVSTTGEGPDVVLLHGLFGMGSNLGSLARALDDVFRVHSLDLPNHGRSDWLARLDIASLAGAVRDWIERQGLDPVRLVGHSLGGKVAMRIALDRGDMVERVVVADIAPVGYEPHHDAVFAALDAVAHQPPRSRGEADRIMAAHVTEEQVRQFLLLSLARGKDGRYHWRFDREGFKRDYAGVREPLTAERPYSGPVLFVKGERSDYILPEHRPVIEALFPQARLKVLMGCGHWLHAEQPRLFNAVVRRFLLGS